MNETACDSKKLIGFLQADQDKGRAWAGVFGISAEQIPEFVGNLTPVILRTDTRVTNHGYVHGHLTTLQSVLESGTAVMLDESGQPAVRCACGNPLSAPVSIADPTYAGAKWRAFNPAAIFVIASPDSNERIKVDAFGVWDLAAKALFWRHRGALIDDVSFTASVVKPPHDEEDPPAHNDDDHDHHHDDPRVTLNLPTTIGIPANDNDDHDDDDDHDPDDPRVTLTLPTSVGLPTKHISQATS
jgi:hypothetical protein